MGNPSLLPCITDGHGQICFICTLQTTLTTRHIIEALLLPDLQTLVRAPTSRTTPYEATICTVHVNNNLHITGSVHLGFRLLHIPRTHNVRACGCRVQNTPHSAGSLLPHAKSHGLLVHTQHRERCGMSVLLSVLQSPLRFQRFLGQAATPTAHSTSSRSRYRGRAARVWMAGEIPHGRGPGAPVPSSSPLAFDTPVSIGASLPAWGAMCPHPRTLSTCATHGMHYKHITCAACRRQMPMDDHRISLSGPLSKWTTFAISFREYIRGGACIS